MTLRAVVIGLLVGLLLAAVGYLNDWILQQAYVASDLVPVSVYGLLIAGLLLANPLLRLAGARPLRGSEWAVIVALLLAACVIPGPGLCWTFTNSLVVPHEVQPITPSWRSKDLVGYAPKILLTDPSALPEGQREALTRGFANGLNPGKLVPPSAVPWAAWTRTLSFWLPLLGLTFVASACLALVVHRQWSSREQLRYPVADFASELIRGAGEAYLPAVFRSRLFYAGFLPVVAILLVNGLAEWHEGMVRIPLASDLRSVFWQKWPALSQMPTAWAVFTPRFFFAGIGFAYFVSKEMSFSVGINAVLYGAIALALTTAGVNMQTAGIEGGPHHWQLFGSYLAAGLFILYIGRRFYGQVLLRALGVGRGGEADRSAVWACRVGLLAAAGTVAMLVLAVGLPVLLAVLLVGLVGLTFLIITRVSVETGLFFIQQYWHPIGVLLGVLGLSALGLHMTLAVAMLGCVLVIDPRVCLMPLAANALRMGESQGVRPPRLTAWITVAILLALVVGVLATLYVQYNFGGKAHGWLSTPAMYPFEMLDRKISQFEGDPTRFHGLRLELTDVDGRFLLWAGIGAGLVLACSALRLRYTWWPIHPVLFLVWGTFASSVLAASFLVGWLLKTVVTHFGGGSAYRKYKPLFVGMVAGEFLAGLIWQAVGLVYYLVRGVAGPSFRVHL